MDVFGPSLTLELDVGVKELLIVELEETLLEVESLSRSQKLTLLRKCTDLFSPRDMALSQTCSATQDAVFHPKSPLLGRLNCEKEFPSNI